MTQKMETPEQRRERVIAAAVQSRKFSTERADHYRAAWEIDPARTERLIAGLEPGPPPPPAPDSEELPPGTLASFGIAEEATEPGPEDPEVERAVRSFGGARAEA
jgi:hypothetical protein